MVLLKGMNIGARVRVYDREGDDLGLATLPTPVKTGDVFALETGPPLRVTAVVELEPGGAIDVVVEAAPARMPIVG
jgi:hypothetical protein